MRYNWLLVPLLLGTIGATASLPARAEFNVGIDIGVNLPDYPRLVLIPGYPVYYDPYFDANYFFYDGLYWVLEDDQWYTSAWYDGPWDPVDEYDVPVFILRVPVAYYRRPPPYFYGWRRDDPPHWNERWGPQWAARRHDWNRWNHRDKPKAAPLPTYQRAYAGARYPRAPQQQRAIRREHYQYRPRDTTARAVWNKVDAKRTSAPARSQTRTVAPTPNRETRTSPRERNLQHDNAPRGERYQREGARPERGPAHAPTSTERGPAHAPAPTVAPTPHRDERRSHENRQPENRPSRPPGEVHERQHAAPPRAERTPTPPRPQHAPPAAREQHTPNQNRGGPNPGHGQGGGRGHDEGHGGNPHDRGRDHPG